MRKRTPAWTPGCCSPRDNCRTCRTRWQKRRMEAYRQAVEEMGEPTADSKTGTTSKRWSKRLLDIEWAMFDAESADAAKGETQDV